MNERHATRSSWKNEPMQGNNIRIIVQRTFTPQEYKELQKGYIPEVMEDKWFIYYEDDWLNIHRSWTGECVYQAHFVRQDDGYQVDEAYICERFHAIFYKVAESSLDPHTQITIIEDYFLYFIDRLLLGKKVRSPGWL